MPVNIFSRLVFKDKIEEKRKAQPYSPGSSLGPAVQNYPHFLRMPLKLKFSWLSVDKKLSLCGGCQESLIFLARITSPPTLLHLENPKICKASLWRKIIIPPEWFWISSYCIGFPGFELCQILIEFMHSLVTSFPSLFINFFPLKFN